MAGTAGALVVRLTRPESLAVRDETYHFGATMEELSGT